VSQHGDFRLQTEKVRVYHLAHELNMESKELLDLCRQHGLDVKNQLSTLNPEQRDAIIVLVRNKGAAAAPKAPTIPPVLQPKQVPNLTGQRPAVVPSRPQVKREPEVAAPLAATPSSEKPITAVPTAATTVKAPEPHPAVRVHEPTPVVTPPPVVRPAESVPAAAKAPEAPRAPEKTPPPPAHTSAPRTQEPPAGHAPIRPPTLPSVGGPRTVRTLTPSGQRPNDGNGSRGPLGRGRVPGSGGRPAPVAGGYRVATPPPQRPIRAIEKKEPLAPTGPRKISEIPQEILNREGPVKMEDIQRAINQQNKPAAKIGPVPVIPDDIVDDEEGADGKKKGAAAKRGPGGVPGRDARHNQRNARQEQRKTKAEVELKGGRAGTLLSDDDNPRVRLKPKKQRVKGPTQPRVGKVPIDMPITVRSLSAAIGKRSGELLFKLMEHGAPPTITINSLIEPDMAEAMALEAGCELDVKHPSDAELRFVEEARKPDQPEDLLLRAPIVTIMGHVDHGKTSLLDKIRKSNVVATEAGGITQVIRAWRVDHGGRPVTFLDTPGHEAFTKMRARGANVTDIAVIVVAADDGVMPQTEEAVSHAKAAGVSIVVAINKVDLPSANVKKTEQQLYGLGLIPDTMGGDVPFIYTSAATGKGVEELLDMLSVVAELRELKANPNKPASGTCLEAKLSEEEGVYATLLVREGTLRRGDVILVGAAYGRVRALYNDLGQPIEEAGPSVPVQITGLDEVPNADDPFLVVPDLSEAREIAENRKSRNQAAALVPHKTMRLEDLAQAKVAELKVILKAEARGSIEAIRKELEKLRHDEVVVRVLHAAIGGITESDVQLALTSPADTLILGFNVVPDDRAQALAEERGVQIRQYNIIYKLTDDVRAALEGKLKPREDVIHLGRAVVRETFRISRTGTIAGCHVTQGVIERSAKVRVIRSGVVVYPPADRTVGLESLKRFKEDVREVREGYECGLKVAGYDDIKVDDIIEAYRIEQVMRTLS
jgi:translation initiation factor IF-2